MRSRVRVPVHVLLVGLFIAPSASAGQAVGPVCAFEELGREHLRFADGRYVYVEPHFYERSDDGLLLLGHPTYVWEIGEGTSVLSEERTFFGVRVVDGVLQRVPNPPVDGRVGYARGARVGPDHVVFLLDVETVDAFGTSVARTPYVADWISGTWHDARPLPPHEGYALRSIAVASDLSPTGVGANVHFAATVGPTARTVLFLREEGEWTTRAVGQGDAGGLALFSKGDRTLLAEAGWGVSGGAPPLLVSRLPDGARVPTPVGSSDGEVQEPVWSSDGASIITRVVTDGAARVVVVEPGRDVEPSGIDGWGQHMTPIDVPGLGPAWLMELPVRPGASRLTALALTPTGLLRADTEYPFLGPFRAAAGASSARRLALDLVGPEAQFPPNPSFVRSLVIRMTLSCP